MAPPSPVLPRAQREPDQSVGNQRDEHGEADLGFHRILKHHQAVVTGVIHSEKRRMGSEVGSLPGADRAEAPGPGNQLAPGIVRREPQAQAQAQRLPSRVTIPTRVHDTRTRHHQRTDPVTSPDPTSDPPQILPLRRPGPEDGSADVWRPAAAEAAASGGTTTTDHRVDGRRLKI
ncbi:hypothetical protein G7046_g6683 [Stylonectria norvegica]|nr:hypothetical protein G7046_g6683 [Stylonectria norvegica]